MKKSDVEHIVYHDMGFCGCGEPQLALAELLELMKKRHSFNQDGHDKHPILDYVEKHKGLGYCVLYVLERADLIEHGSNIMFSWLTLKGEEFLKYFNDNPDLEKFFFEED